jgi:hypothetical protein
MQEAEDRIVHILKIPVDTKIKYMSAKSNITSVS